MCVYYIVTKSSLALFYNKNVEKCRNKCMTYSLFKIFKMCMEILSITPNTLYKQLIKNNSITKQLEISEDINSLPNDKLEFVINIIKNMKELK